MFYPRGLSQDEGEVLKCLKKRKMTINQLSEKLLLAVKMETDTDDLIKGLYHLPLIELQRELKDDYHKKAFWINIYNAFFQILRKQKSIEKPSIYKDKLLSIAGQLLSLDDVEHGILRKYRYKFSLGYLQNPFFPRIIKKLAVSSIDYRIHFALNCGAKSCPPIAFYSSDKVHHQLDIATQSFLESDTDIFDEEKEIHITSLFQWFRGDFGGQKGIRRILQTYLDDNVKEYKLIYKPYSWDEQLNNYADE